MIDFRSDTVTKPTPEMLDFMINAPVGDDVFGDDPTINELQEYSADLFGFEAALYCSSGTQTNQIAINVHCRPGDEVITHKESHIYKYEGGGIAKNSGTSVRLLEGNRGRVTAADVEKWINPDDVHLPITSLVSLEDTSNRGGGAIYDFEEIKKIKEVCKKANLPLHLDGARMYNSLVETGMDYKEYAKPFDSISICLSKGLGAPVGSLLLGSKDFIKRSHRVRKVFGGGMRQAGIIAAGGLFALKNNVERLKEDHLNAKKIEAVLNELSWVASVLPVETNIVVASVREDVDVNQVVSLLAEKDIHIMKFGPKEIRFVTHLNISNKMIETTLQALDLKL